MNTSIKPLTSVLVKPTGADCNLDCKYCFYLEKAELYPDKKTHRMSEDILEELIKQSMQQSGPDINFTWQGGEPTQMGIDFFKKIIELEIKHGKNKNIGNGLQTNGTLLDESWVDFLKEYNWLVGLSIDGPEHVHDHYRLNKDGKGSWKKVYDNAKLLIKNGVSVNALTCITNYSAKHPHEIYYFLKNIGLSWMQFIPILETDKSNSQKSAPFSVSPEAYGQFLCQIFDLWWNDYIKGTHTTSVRFIESVFFNYVGLRAPECTLQKECGSYVVAEHNGDIYSCDFFVTEKWKLGNIKSERLFDMLNSKQQNRFGRLKNVLDIDCRCCKWLTYCKGGCPKDRHNNPETLGRNHFCTSYKIFFKHADGRLSWMAKQWQEEQKRNKNPQAFDASGYFK